MAAEQPNNGATENSEQAHLNSPQLELDFSQREAPVIAAEPTLAALLEPKATTQPSSSAKWTVVAVCAFIMVATILLCLRARYEKPGRPAKALKDVSSVVPARLVAAPPIYEPTRRTENARPALVRLQFSRIDNHSAYRANRNSPPLPKVLTKFAVERDGNNLQFFDADGSIYSGSVVSNSAVHVSGFNRRFNQKVSFTGAITNNETLMQGRVHVGNQAEFDMQAARLR
jgi:hypothetical protein